MLQCSSIGAHSLALFVPPCLFQFFGDSPAASYHLLLFSFLAGFTVFPENTLAAYRDDDDDDDGVFS